MATKAQEIYEQTQRLMEQGMSRTDAFRKIASDTGLKYDSVRGSYYTHKLKAEGGSKTPRTKRRETTPDDALADARTALERSIEAIDREVEAARERAQEAAAEYEAIRGSAEERKAAIAERLESLK